MKNYILTEEICFDSKPDAVPYNYRISYKISQICLIIAKSCTTRSGCSLIKLHIISNALNSKDSMSELLRFIDKNSTNMIVRFDSAVNKALKFAFADSLIVQLKNGTYKLTNKGKDLVKLIDCDSKLLVNEKIYLAQIGNRLTNNKIEKLVMDWRYNLAED